MTTTDLDELLDASRPATAADDPRITALLAPLSAAARDAAVEPATTRVPGRRRASLPLVAVALGGSLLLGAGALVEGLQPDHQAHAEIVFVLPDDPFVDDGVGAPARCTAVLLFDVVDDGAHEQEAVETAVASRDWSALGSQLADVVRQGRGEAGLGADVVDALDAGLRSALDPALVGTARYGGVSLTCGGAA